MLEFQNQSSELNQKSIQSSLIKAITQGNNSKIWELIVHLKDINVPYIDKDGMRIPLIFYAKKPKTFNLLLGLGANPYLRAFDPENGSACNIVDFAGFNKNPLMNYIKLKIGFSSSKLYDFSTSIKSMLAKEMEVAKKYGKKILVMIGETHHHYLITQVETAILEAANALGIKYFMYEQNNDDLQRDMLEYLNSLKKGKYEFSICKLFKSSQDKGMTIIGVDKGHKFARTKPNRACEERNILMKEEILKHDRGAILIVGSAHLQGLLNKESSIAFHQYHIIPLNLSTLDNPNSMISFNNNIIESSKISKIFQSTKEINDKLKEKYYFSKLYDFAFEKDNVIQVESPSLDVDLRISNPYPVISRWNPQVEVEIARSQVSASDIEESAYSLGKITPVPTLRFSSSSSSNLIPPPAAIPTPAISKTPAMQSYLSSNFSSSSSSSSSSSFSAPSPSVEVLLSQAADSAEAPMPTPAQPIAPAFAKSKKSKRKAESHDAAGNEPVRANTQKAKKINCL